jgi:hypothetical protein
MLPWLKSILRRPNPAREIAPIKTDPESLSLVDEYRRRFSSAPIGVWLDCYDELMGTGFGGVSGKFEETTFFPDGTGRANGEYEAITFQWRPVGDRVIEVRCVECVAAANGGTVEKCAEDQHWQRVEYDFIVPRFVNVPTIFDVTAGAANRIADGSIDPFKDLNSLGCLNRAGGTLRLKPGR